jgi:hypothetical protein
MSDPRPSPAPALEATVLLRPRAQWVCWMLIALGVLVFGLALARSEAQRVWQVYLVNWLFWSGLAVTGVVLVAIWRATNSQWGARLLGVALATFGFAPVALLTFLPLAAAGAHIFPWIEHPVPHRAGWLKPGFVLARNGLAFTVLLVLCGVYVYFLLRPAAGEVGAGRSWSRAWLVRGFAGRTAEQARAESILRRLTPVLLVLYGLVFSLVAFDLVMPLDPHFYSTLFGGYFFVTALYAGIALLSVLLAWWLVCAPSLRDWFTTEVRHPLGKLTFGFAMLYGLVFWSQYLVFWYGNLPEEIPYVILRQNVLPWKPLAYAVLFLVLLVPFAVLISAEVKKKPRAMAFLGSLILLGIWLERYLLVVPSLWGGGTHRLEAAVGGTGDLASAASGVVHAADGTATAHAAAVSYPVPLPLGGVEIGITLAFAAAFLLSYAAFAHHFPLTLSTSPSAPEPHH